MQTRLTVRGYPLHPLLVTFPIAFYVAGWGMLVAFVLGASAFWYHASYVALLSGGGLALLSAIVGALDLSRVPQDIRAKRIGIVHGGLNVGATLLFLSAGLVMRSDWLAHGEFGSLEIGVPLALATLAMGLLGSAGVLGVRLVSSEHVGISPMARRGGRVRLGGNIDHPAPSHLASLDAIAIVKDQHDRIDSLLQSLQVAPPAVRRELFVELCNLVEAHAEMEEALLYRSFELPDGRHLTSFAEDHREVRRLLSRIGRDCEDDPRFLDDIAYLRAAIGAHQMQEERELLPLVAASIDAGDRELLGDEMQQLFDEIVAEGPHRKIEAQGRRTAHV